MSNITFKALVNDLYLYFCFACRRLGIPGYQVHQIYLPEQNLIYIPIPKNACTSIMHALHEIEFGIAYDHHAHREKGYRDIHDYYQKRKHSFTGVDELKKREGIRTFAVIRDPVKRLISCYRNRVVDLKDLEKSKAALRQRKLPLEPDIDTFVLNLKEYQQVNKIIEHHSRPQASFLGYSLCYLDEIIPIEDLARVKKLLKGYKPDLELRTAKSGGSSFGLKDLSSEALEAAITYYQEDYSLLAAYYSPEQIRKKHQQQKTS